MSTSAPGIQVWHVVMGDMRKKVDIPPFEIAQDVGHGIKQTECSWRFKGNWKDGCRDQSSTYGLTDSLSLLSSITIPT